MFFDLFDVPVYNKGDYGQIEQRKEEKYRLKKWWRNLYYAAYIITAWFIVGLLMDNEAIHSSQVDVTDYFLISYGKGIENSSVNLYAYYITASTILFLFFGVFMAEGKDEILDRMYGLDAETKKVGILLKVKYKLVCYLDKFFYYLFLPISYMVLPLDTTSPAVRKKFFIRYGWLSHLKFNYFRKTIEQVDGYERAESIKLFENYPLLFSAHPTLDAAKASHEFRSFVNLFKSKEHFEDILYIVEGYLTNSLKKFDKQLTKEEFEDRLKNKFGGKLDNFTLFDGRNEVCFSFDLIDRLIDEETKRFNMYIENFTFSKTGLGFTRTYQKYYELLKRDKQILTTISELQLPHPCALSELTEKELIKRLKIIFEIYFRFLSFFYIVNQYINLPAGTVVVKMKDYSIRMITEIYDNKTIVSIDPGKNDGTNPEFRSDTLVNMFLLAWNYYNYSVDNAFMQRVYKIFNFRDVKVESSDIGESIIKSEEAMQTLRYLNETPAPEINLSGQEQTDVNGLLFGYGDDHKFTFK